MPMLRTRVVFTVDVEITEIAGRVVDVMRGFLGDLATDPRVNNYRLTVERLTQAEGGEKHG